MAIHQLQTMEETRIKTGIFGGSFNPIHIGHLALANYLCEYTQLDEIWFMVSPRNPLKGEDELLPDELRLSLVRSALQDYPHIHVSDFEFHLPRPSYMLRTFEALESAYPDRDFHLIIGADNWQLFPRWHQSQEIIRRYPILIYPRPGYVVDTAQLPPLASYVDAPQMEISSTFIRKAMQEGKDVRFFLPESVYPILKSYYGQRYS